MLFSRKKSFRKTTWFFSLAKKMQPEKSVCVCNSHFWYTYTSKDCGNIVSHLRDLSSVFFFSQGHFCCSSGNCNTFRFNEPGFLPSECILRCSNLATEQWRVPRGWNGKGPPRIRVPRYMFNPSFGALNEDFRTSKNQFQDILHLGLKMKSLVFKMISIHFMLPGFPLYSRFCSF